VVVVASVIRDSREDLGIPIDRDGDGYGRTPRWLLWPRVHHSRQAPGRDGYVNSWNTTQHARPRSDRTTRTPEGGAVTRTITHTTHYTPLADSVGIITPARHRSRHRHHQGIRSGTRRVCQRCRCPIAITSYRCRLAAEPKKTSRLLKKSIRAAVGAVYDRALFLESTNTRGHRPRLQYIRPLESIFPQPANWFLMSATAYPVSFP
jgi:hypothetical protein